MAQRNKYPGVTMQPSRPGPYGEPQWAYFGGRPAWMDRRQVGPETTSEVLAGMGGQEDRLGALAGADRVPPQDVTTVIKEYADETPNTKTTTIKGGLLGDPAQDWAGRGAERDERGMQDWYAHMAQAQARRQQGTAAPDEAQARAALTDAAKQSWDYSMFGLPQTIAKKIVGQPSAPSVYPHQMGITPPSRPPLPPVQGDFPGRGAERDERGMRDWYAQMAQAQARQQQGTAAPDEAQARAALTDAARQSWDYSPFGLPATIAKRLKGRPGTDFFGGDPTAPPGPVPPPQVDVGQGDFPGRTAEFDERGMQDWNAQMAQLRNRQQTGGAAPTQAQVEESLGRYGDFRRQQLTPPPVGRTFGQDDPMAYAPPQTQIDPRIQALNEMDMPTRLSGQDLPREVTEGGQIDTRPRGTMGRGGISQDIGKLPTGKDSKQDDSRQMEANPNLEKIWGKYAYDPKARRKFYLDNLKDIWRKALLMDVVANLTGGQSMSKRYLEMATGRLEQMEKFNEEERISNIWREVFTDANGNFYMPKTKREAAERAGKTGARPAVIKDIFGSVPDVKKKVQYHRVDPKDPTKWEHKRFEADEDVPDEWISGKAGSKSPEAEEIASIKAFNFLRDLEARNSPHADEYASIINARRGDKRIATGTGITFFNSMIGDDGQYTLPEGENNFSMLQKFLSLPEVTLITQNEDGDDVEVVVPGWSAITGKKLSEKEITKAIGKKTDEPDTGSEKSYASEADFMARAESEGVKSGDWVIINGIRRQVK